MSGRAIHKKLLLIALPVAVLVMAVILVSPHLFGPPAFPGLAFPSEEAFENALMRDCSGMFPSSEFTEDQANEYLQTRGIRYPNTYCRPLDMPADAELAYIEVAEEHILYAYAYDYDTERDPYLQKAGPEHQILLYRMRDPLYGTDFIKGIAEEPYTEFRDGFYVLDDQTDVQRIIWRATYNNWFLAQFPKYLDQEQALDLCRAEEIDAPAYNERMDGSIVITTDLVSWSDAGKGTVHRAQVDLPVIGTEQPRPIIVDDDLCLWYQEENRRIMRYNIEKGTSEAVWTAQDSVEIDLCYVDASYLVWTEYVRFSVSQEEKYRLVALDRTTGSSQSASLMNASINPPGIRRQDDLLYFLWHSHRSSGTYLMAFDPINGTLEERANGQFQSFYPNVNQILWQERLEETYNDVQLIWHTLVDGKAIALSDQDLIDRNIPILKYESLLEYDMLLLSLQRGIQQQPLMYETGEADSVVINQGSIRDGILALGMTSHSPNTDLTPLLYDLNHHVTVELDTESFEVRNEDFQHASYIANWARVQTHQTKDHILFYIEDRADETPYKLDLIWIDREDLP